MLRSITVSHLCGLCTKMWCCGVYPQYSATDWWVEYCDDRVCLSVCLSASRSLELHIWSSPIFVHVTYGRGSVLLWWRSDTLRIYGFTDGVVFARKPRLLDVTPNWAKGCMRSLGLGYKRCAVIPVASKGTCRPTFRALNITFQVVAPGAESAVYDCLVSLRMIHELIKWKQSS